MELASLLFSGCGFLISIYAIVTATGVKSAVDGAIKKVNIQNDISEINEILRKLNKAKTAANIWIPGAVGQSQIGRDSAIDLRVVRDALDALAVWVPVDMIESSKSRLDRERIGLLDYCDLIADPTNNENHWNGVIFSTQSLIKLLREYLRTLGN